MCLQVEAGLNLPKNPILRRLSAAGAVRFVPAAGPYYCDVVLATCSTVRAFVANESAWSFLPLSRQHADAELWMSPSDDEAHAATNENYQGFGTMRITHQPAPADE